MNHILFLNKFLLGNFLSDYDLRQIHLFALLTQRNIRNNLWFRIKDSALCINVYCRCICLLILYFSGYFILNLILFLNKFVLEKFLIDYSLQQRHFYALLIFLFRNSLSFFFMKDAALYINVFYTGVSLLIILIYFLLLFFMYLFIFNWIYKFRFILDHFVDVKQFK